MKPTRWSGVVAALGLLLAGCTSIAPDEASGPVAAGNQPNIVFVLVDDMDTELLRHMPTVRRMQAEGVTFDGYSVSNSLCCPSRASFLTGRYPHNSGVRTNTPPTGGWKVFHRNGQEKSTIGTDLQQAGYRTGLLGKYLNGYRPGGAEPFVPPGWDEWAVAGNGYPNYDYALNVNGGIERHGHRPEDYLTDVLARRGEDFITRSANAKNPFFLTVAPFTPHTPADPAPRHQNALTGLTAPRGPAFDEADRSDKPEWLRSMPGLRPDQLARIDQLYGKRARSLLAIDDMLRGFRDTLVRTGQSDNTYVVFSSDNGFHLGQHALPEGKQTPYRTDTDVPLIVTGPGVSGGQRDGHEIENIDLRPTFVDLAGAPPTPGVDGRSFANLVQGKDVPGWRTVSLVEHVGPNDDPDDPDRPAKGAANPPTYRALHDGRRLYVEYFTGEREYYDLITDPYQLTNTYGGLPAQYRTELHRTVAALSTCAGTEQCTAHLP